MCIWKFIKVNQQHPEGHQCTRGQAFLFLRQLPTRIYSKPGLPNTEKDNLWIGPYLLKKKSILII